VVGYSEPQGTRRYFGALLLGYYEDDGELTYAGRVGTGFDRALLAEIAGQLDGLEQPKPPVKDPPRGSLAHGVTWVRPELVAEIEFANWTGAGRLRQPSFKGLRQDKPAGEVRRERPEPAPGKEMEAMEKTDRKGKPAPVQVAGVTLSNPDRVLFPEMEVTKRQLAEYYALAADWVLPHVVERPLTLVRCPSGRGKKCFFQKHYDESFPEAVGSVHLVEKDEEEADYFLIHDLEGLVGLVQMGVLELHPWSSRADKLERPDQMIFDLDPDPGIGWPEVRKAAMQVRDRLEETGLESFVKTSGGKGLHVAVPLARRSSWEEVYDFAKAFAQDMASADPDRYTANASKAKRKGKIFIDYLRNNRGATNVAAYSTRAREGAPVSTPLRWEELPGLEGSKAYHLGNLPARLSALRGDPWEGFFETKQSITKAMRESLG
jgi:bifunctional non-homologous end joining protein LigD